MAIVRRLKDKVTRLNLWPSPPPEEGFVGLAVLWLWEIGDRELSDDDLDPVYTQYFVTLSMFISPTLR